tara:strand:+ start:1197 stop:1991 length:795 start_codon:yes stop_codon:yes gene_type:complete
MKKYLVIGNPIEHSLSPRLHNYWINQNKIKAIYDKKLINEKGIKDIIFQIKTGDITGVNVTVPFKKSVIPYLEKLSPEANASQSVNTIYLEDNKITGHNTDIAGFELSLRYHKYDVKDKKVLILGAGGVAPSIILSLKKMNASQIILCNRTKSRAENLKKIYNYLDVVNWGDIPEFDMIVNATSVGLKKNEEIDINFQTSGSNKFYYDVIYNPRETMFLKKAKEQGNIAENGIMMFVYQAHQAFTIWHKIMPKIDEETLKLLTK